MGEAALGPAETSKEIAEHTHHSRHGSERDSLISILEAGLLAVVALLAAWSGYSAAKWSTESRLTVAEATTARNESNTEELVALDERLGDGLVFNAWLGAHATGNPEATDIALKRFRPELRVAFDAWIATDPDNNPASPPGPQAMPEYKQPEKAHATALRAKANASPRRERTKAPRGTTTCASPCTWPACSSSSESVLSSRCARALRPTRDRGGDPHLLRRAARRPPRAAVLTNAASGT